MPHSDGRRSPLRALHDRHDATTLSHVCEPRRDRGTTWSRFSAARPQYWHRWASRANTARRERGALARNGTRTKWTSRMTVGTGAVRRSERNSAPLRWTISAFSLSTRTTARRDDTTHSGSKLALSKSARATRYPPPGARVYWRLSDVAGERVEAVRVVRVLSPHQSMYATRSRGGGAVTDPYAVSRRKRT